MKKFTDNTNTLSDISEYSDMQGNKKSVIDDIRQTFDIRKKDISYDEETKTVHFLDVGDMPYTAVLSNASDLNEVDEEVLDVLVDNSYQPEYIPKYTKEQLKGVKAEIRSLHAPRNNEVNYNPLRKLVTYFDYNGMSYSVDLRDYEVFEYPDDIYVLNTVKIEPVPKYTMDDMKSVFGEIEDRFNIEKVDIAYDYPYDVEFTACDKMGYYVMDYKLDLSKYEMYIYGDVPYVPKDTVLDYEPLYSMDDLTDLEDYIDERYPGKSHFSMNGVWCEYAIFKYNNKIYTVDLIGYTVYKINGKFYVTPECDINIQENGLISLNQYYAEKYCIEENDVSLIDNTVSFVGLNGVQYSAIVNEEFVIFPTFPGVKFVKSSYSQLAVPEKASSLPDNYYRTVKQIQQLTGLSIDADIVQDERYYILVYGNIIPFDKGMVYTKYDSVYTTPEDFKEGLLKTFPIDVKETLESMGFEELRNNSGTAIYRPIGYNSNTKKVTLFGVDLNIDNAIYVGEFGNRNTNSILGPVLVNTFGKAFSNVWVKSDDIKNYICAYYNYNSSVCSVNGYTVTFMGHSFSIGDEVINVTLAGIRFVRKEDIDIQVKSILSDVLDTDNSKVELFEFIENISSDLSKQLLYDENTRTLHIGSSEISDEDIIYDPAVSEIDYDSREDYVKAAAVVSESLAETIVTSNTVQPTTIIEVPIDSRPVTNQHFELLTQIGGDKCIIVKDGLDNGFDFVPETDKNANRYFNLGNSRITRNSLLNIVESTTGNKSIIINTASYFTNGLIGSRMPTSYYASGNECISDMSERTVDMENEYIDLLIEDLRELCSNVTESGSRIYVNCIIPRTLPCQQMYSVDPNEKRPTPEGVDDVTWANAGWEFDWDMDGNGFKTLRYFKDNTMYKPNPNYDRTACEQIIYEWAYLACKQGSGAPMEDYETACLEYYNSMYNTPNQNKYNKMFIAYKNIFVNTEYMIRKLMNLVSENMIDELTIGMDDISFPDFYKELAMVGEFDTNSEKYSFAKTCLDNVQEYQKQLFNAGSISDNILDSIECCAEHINYLMGADEIPQLIYARDLTRRMKHTPRYLNYNLYATGNMFDKGEFDINSIEDIVRKTENFITNTSYYDNTPEEEYLKKRYYRNVYDVGEMHTFIRCAEKTKTYNDAVIAAKQIYNAFDDPYTNMDTQQHRRDNGGNINMCLIDSALSGSGSAGGAESGIKNEYAPGADWLLLHTLKELYNTSVENKYKKNSVSQFAAYSAWNTVANSLGLGLAHAQVFAVMDTTFDNMNPVKAKTILEAHVKLLAIHMLEDALFNRMKSSICNLFKDSYSSNEELVQDENYLFSVLNSDEDSTGEIPPIYGGSSWVLDRFNDTGTIHRFNNYNYDVTDLSLLSITFPWKRRFECLIKLNAEIDNVTQYRTE